MNPFKWLAKRIRVISPADGRRPNEQGFVSIEVIPREITNVIVNTQPQANLGAQIDDTCGYETLRDAVSDAERIGFRLLGYIEPENLLFAFSESVKVLQRFLFRFLIKNRVPYSPDNLFAPISQRQRDAYEKTHPKQRAIVLCKVRHAEVFQNPIWGKQKKSSNSGNCYEISWSEVQKLQEHPKETVPHDVLPSDQ